MADAADTERPHGERAHPLSEKARRRLLNTMWAKASAGDWDVAIALVRLSIAVSEDRARAAAEAHPAP